MQNNCRLFVSWTEEGTKHLGTKYNVPPANHPLGGCSALWSHWPEGNILAHHKTISKDLWIQTISKVFKDLWIQTISKVFKDLWIQTISKVSKDLCYSDQQQSSQGFMVFRPSAKFPRIYNVQTFNKVFKDFLYSDHLQSFQGFMVFRPSAKSSRTCGIQTISKVFRDLQYSDHQQSF